MAVNTNTTSDVNCKVKFHCSFIYMTLLFGIMTNTTAVNECCGFILVNNGYMSDNVVLCLYNIVFLKHTNNVDL